jgi:phosphatidylserine decarboxylase
MMLARYARLETTLILLLGAGASAAVGYWWGWWALAPLVLTLALLSFYRDPPRRPPQAPDTLLAPADGRVIRVERGYRSSPEAGPELRIAIFLSVLNVHVNRAPCAGVVREVQYRPGLFLNALKLEALERNEASEMSIEPEAPLPGPVHVRQIAGLLAKRIVCAAAPGERLTQGQRFGMIKLGSQTELRAPEDPRWRVLVREGDTVRGGLTRLARLEPERRT